MNKPKRIVNAEFARSPWFLTVCKDLCISPTVRQASKFRQKKGMAYLLSQNLATNEQIKATKFSR